MANYSSLNETHDPDEEGHVLFHSADPSRARWNHIEDLDSFFSRMYQYHQRHGFLCMLLQEILELLQFVFIVCLTSLVFYGINYAILFRYDRDFFNSTITKVTLRDVTYPLKTTVANFTLFAWICIVIAILVWLLKLMKGVYHMFHFWDIKQFYNTALKIDDLELDNLTWHEVQTRVRTVQIEQQMCIHKRELTELDIYHRILRQQNYLVALVNKRLIPPRLKLPFVGEWVYWTTGLRLNIQLLLFWSPWSPFENPWQLREEYKKQHLRHDLAQELGRHIRYLAIINLILSPLILFYHILYAFFNYAAIIRREPGILAVRRWSLYGRLYLRHFNELEHELQARLTRAHRPSTKYVSAFSSPISTIISENMGFYATSFLAVFLVLSIIDEDVLTVEHVISIMTILGVVVAILRTVAPDETACYDLEGLLTKVVHHTHYLPSNWVGQAHTSRVRKEFEQLFQYGFISLLETILSPLVTPYVLWFHVYPRSMEFVDFFRHFTVNVVGVGDVCSFAQMDVKRNGNPDWHDELPRDKPDDPVSVIPDQFSQCEDGKVELSLCHFKTTNPSWRPPPDVEDFVRNVQNLSSMVGSENVDPYHRLDNLDQSGPPRFRIGSEVSSDILGPLSDTSIYASSQRSRGASSMMHMSHTYNNEGPSVSGRREMALNAHYLHMLHGSKVDPTKVRVSAQETTPLLDR